MIRVEVAAAPGRARVHLSGDVISPRLIRVEERGAVVGLVASQALLLGGDDVSIDVDVGAGMWLEVREIAGTVAYDAAGEPSGWAVQATVARGARLVWHGEPFVIADGANVDRRTDVRLDTGAVAVIRETLVFGRTGERGGALRSRSRVELAGRPLHAEDLDLVDERDRARPGMLGSARVIDTVAVFGVRAAPTDLPTGTRFDLAGAGTVLRVLAADTAGSPLHETWLHETIAHTATLAGLVRG